MSLVSQQAGALAGQSTLKDAGVYINSARLPATSLRWLSAGEHRVLEAAPSAPTSHLSKLT